MSRTTEVDDTNFPEVWDKEEIYDREVAPLTRQLAAVCREHRLPLACFVMFSKSETNQGISTTSGLSGKPDMRCDIMRLFVEVIRGALTPGQAGKLLAMLDDDNPKGDILMELLTGLLNRTRLNEESESDTNATKH